LALARCLAEVAGWRLSGSASAPLLAATGRKSGLVDRIERLLDARPASETWNDVRAQRRLLAGAAILLALLTWCAPRVQIAMADLAPSSNAMSDRPPVDQDKRQFLAADAGRIPMPEDAANRPTDREIAFRDLAPPSYQPRESASAALDDSSKSVGESLEALARELHDLERELAEIQPLLLDGNPPPRLVRLAERLQIEIAKLKRNREALYGNWKKSVGQLARE